VVSGRGIVKRKRGRAVSLRAGSLVLIEHGDEHEVRNTGRTPLRTLNLYAPPAYTTRGDELPRGKP
jgi:mannose-6-phosphate isomerase-like protein (cupin superfamily)